MKLLNFRNDPWWPCGFAAAHTLGTTDLTKNETVKFDDLNKSLVRWSVKKLLRRNINIKLIYFVLLSSYLDEKWNFIKHCRLKYTY